jgi:hypothetical protein
LVGRVGFEAAVMPLCSPRFSVFAQGASVKAVQAQLGHATASITLDSYGTW